MAAVTYHEGGFPPRELDWPRLLPLVGLFGWRGLKGFWMKCDPAAAGDLRFLPFLNC